MDVREWFDQETPRPRVSSKWVSRALKSRRITDDPKAERRCVWIGAQPVSDLRRNRTRLRIPGQAKATVVMLPHRQAIWVYDLLREALLQQNRTSSYPLLRDAMRAFPGKPADFESFMKDSSWKKIRAAGLLLV